MPEYFSIEPAQMNAISRRAEELTRWLADKASYCMATQKHLEEGSIEQAYWHYGYLCALRDVVTMIEKRSTK
jgi:hypothetical protein